MMANPLRKLLLLMIFGLILEVISEEISEKSDIRGRLAFGSFSTTTFTSVSLTTSTIFPSCLTGTSAALCPGRRHKWRRNLDSNLDIKSLDVNIEDALEGSQVKEVKAENDIDDKSEKLAFTIWTTAATTTTATVLYTDTATTFTLSYICTASWAPLPPNFC